MKRFPPWLDGLWLACLGLYILAGAQIMPFHGDESTLMIMGRDYHYLAVEGDLSKVLYDETWQDNHGEQLLRILNGTISKYIYGWLQTLNGRGPGDLNRDWMWGRDYDFNASRGALPAADLLRWARLASALQLALAGAAFFQFVKLSVDRPTAWLASALFALHPNMLINGRRAMMEGSHILGLTLVLLAGILLLRERRWHQYALLGFCGGLAVAAKHPNAIVCALVYLACLRAPIWRLARGHAWRGAARDLAGVALAGGITALVFLLLNPAWWNAPLELPPVIIDLRTDLLRRQVTMFGGYESFAGQLSGFFEFTFVGARQYFEVDAWRHYDVISGQIAEYEGSGLAGLRFIGESGRLGLLVLLICVFGALKLALDSGVSREARWLILLWSAGAALSTLWLTPLPWARYYLPLLPAVSLLVAYVAVRAARDLTRTPGPRADGIDPLD